MKYLKNKGIRIIISLLLAGMISELTRILKGTAHKSDGSPLIFIWAILIFTLLTYLVKRKYKDQGASR